MCIDQVCDNWISGNFWGHVNFANFVTIFLNNLIFIVRQWRKDVILPHSKKQQKF